MEKISSFQNPKIKNLVKLHKAHERKNQNLFLVEGLKEIKMASEAGYNLHSLYWNPELEVSRSEVKKLSNENSIFEITNEIFSKIAYRDSSDGLMAIFVQKKLILNNFIPDRNSLVIVIESVEKPGNLGAILRTADAASVDAILVCDPKTDIFNPNVVRSSLGCIFTNRIIVCRNEEALEWLKIHKFCIYSAVLNPNAKIYSEINYTRCSSAVVLGTEADGLTSFWLDNCNEKIIIPMLGKIDSLNVSNSAAIIVYEIMRQKGFVKYREV
jgi:RNA methyltransferase, TrmH family